MNIIREMYIKIYMYTTTIYLKLTQTVVYSKFKYVNKVKVLFLIDIYWWMFKVLNRILRWIAF